MKNQKYIIPIAILALFCFLSLIVITKTTVNSINQEKQNQEARIIAQKELLQKMDNFRECQKNDPLITKSDCLYQY